MTKPNGVIAFISDFGPHSPYVGLVHLVVEKLGGGRVKLIDVAHNVRSFDVRAGAYVLYAAHRYAPEGTVFLVVVDPGVGGSREPVAIETRRFYLVGPNNGVLWPVVAADGLVKAVVLDEQAVWLKPVSYTFHGRDIFAPAATLLALGTPIESLGSPIPGERLVKLELKYVAEREGMTCLKVVYVDDFGNVALSAERGDGVYERACRRGLVEACSGERCVTARCVRSFSEVGEGEAALYYNSFGFVEVAVYKGSAAKELGVREGDEVCLAGR